MEKRLLVIQEHNAKRAGLHWDVRFEKFENEFENKDIDSYISKRSSDSNEPMSTTMKKSLLSFVIPKHEFPPKGEVRMAIKVEDHIWEYKDFEGTIESGYGAGEVKIIFKDYVNIEEFTKDKVVFQFNEKWYTIFRVGKNYLITLNR